MTRLETHRHILSMVLDNSPDNRLTSPVFMEKDYLMDVIDKQLIKAVIIKGAGRHFSSGAEIDSIKKQLESGELEPLLQKGKDLLNALYDLDIPVICAIEGVCFGGGLEIALSAHIRVVSEKALLAFPETMHDLMPGLAGSYRLKKHMGMGKSLELLLTNTVLQAPEAVEYGMADYVCPPKTTADFARKLAEKMTHNKPLRVINSVMQAVKNAYTMSAEEALKEETRLFCQLASNLDHEN